MQLGGLLAEQRALHGQARDAGDHARGFGLLLGGRGGAAVPGRDEHADEIAPGDQRQRERRDLDLARRLLARAREPVRDLRHEARLLRPHDGARDLQLGVEQRPAVGRPERHQQLRRRLEQRAARRAEQVGDALDDRVCEVVDGARARRGLGRHEQCAQRRAGRGHRGAGRERRNCIEAGIGRMRRRALAWTRDATALAP